MPPKGSKRQRHQQQTKKTQQVKRRFETLDVADEPETSTAAEAATPDDGPDVLEELDAAIIPPATRILTHKFPLFEEWETLEEEESQQVTKKHGAHLRWTEPEYLPIQVHCAAPVAKRFTREIESDMVECNNIEAVKDIVKSSLLHELIRTNIDPLTVRFAGLMVYGPTNEFAPKTIHSHARGLFLQEAAFKKWWLTVNMSKRAPGEMVKIAVVLWDQQEALDHRVDLPLFWTEPNARIIYNQLEKIELPLWDLDVEKGCRAYVKMQKQVQEERIKAAEAMGWQDEKKDLIKENGKLVGLIEELGARYDALGASYDGLIAAIENGDADQVSRLVALRKKAVKGKGKATEADGEVHVAGAAPKSKGKGKAKEVVVVDEEEDDEDVEFEDAEDIDDPDDQDYVE